MPSDDYAPIIRGGLKLKGKGAQPEGVKKKKKKPKTDKPAAGSASERGAGLNDMDEEEGETRRKREVKTKDETEDAADERALRDLEARDVALEGDTKTPTERAREEMKRKRLHERLQREGIKTHKQRVEELNTYLANLSEHHDLPKIGPG